MRFAVQPSPAAKGRDPRRAVLIDKDGTLVENVPYNVDPALLQFTPHAVPALRKLAAAGFKLFVVSNQPGIAQRHFSLDALDRLSQGLAEMLAAEGVTLSGFYACPHAPRPAGDGCRCRKPAPGLLLEAARHHGLDLARSWMVGDILDDVEAGRRAGCRTVLLDVGNETEWVRSPLRVPHRCAAHLGAAADAILAARSPLPVPVRRRATARESAIRRQRPGGRKARSRGPK